MQNSSVQRSGILGVLLERIVNDIFDSSSSDDDGSSNDSADSPGEDSEILPIDQNNDPMIYFPEGLQSTYFGSKYYNLNLDAIISDFGPGDFKEHFAISRKTFNYLVNLLKDDLTRKKHGNKQVPAKVQLLMALRRMCKGDAFSQICVRFGTGKATSTRSVKRVTESLSKLASEFIEWPSGKRVQTICQGFQKLSEFPKVIGSLGSTHITIPDQQPDGAKTGDPNLEHTVQLQVVVDHKGRFTHCHVGVTDLKQKQDIFNSSELYDFVTNASEHFPDDCHLVAGPEYDLHENILVPYSGANLTPQQQIFNENLHLAHDVVIQAFKMLKGRFASLRHKLEINRVENVPEFITACCILHNICVNFRDSFECQYDSLNIDPTAPIQIGAVSSIQASRKRAILCEQMHLSKTEGVVFV